MDQPDGINIEQLVTSVLKQTSYKLDKIRTTFKDIIDLMVSVEILSLKEGFLTTFDRK